MNSMVYLAVRVLTDYVPVILRPSSDHRVELQNQMSGSSLLAILHDFSDFVQERLYVLAGRLDEQLALAAIAILADILSEKIEPFFDMHDASFLRGEV